jgi:outer membrane receptor protein involved in Fe transport
MFYVQNDWRVAPRLSLNLGLRYDLIGPPFDADNRLGVRPSNRCNGHVTSFCAPIMSLARRRDGRADIHRAAERLDLAFTSRGDTA